MPRAIDSVLLQNVPNLELIVVDDGSDDNTQQVIESLYSQVNYIKQRNLGVSAARNTAIREANGEWIAFLDSDDEWLDDKLEAQLAYLDKSKLKVCHTEEVWIRNGVRVNQMNKHQKYGGFIFQKCLPLCAMSPSSILIHRDVFDDVGLFDESLPACEDYDLWLRIASSYEVAYLEQAYIKKYGGHEDQLSRLYWGMDRFRVIALDKLLKQAKYVDRLNQLDGVNKQGVQLNVDAALSMLLKKLKILLKGAIKHNNQILIDECQTKMEYWNSASGVGHNGDQVQC